MMMIVVYSVMVMAMCSVMVMIVYSVMVMVVYDVMVMVVYGVMVVERAICKLPNLGEISFVAMRHVILYVAAQG